MGTWSIVIIWLSFINYNWASLSVDLDDDFRECGNGLPYPAVDLSNFEIIQEEDGSMTMNGTIQFTGDFESPTRFRLYSQKLERGVWVTGVFNRDVLNMCPVLQLPYEIWYPVTSIMEQKSCPYRAGHIEPMRSINIGNYAQILNLPPSFVGEWRVFFEATTTRNRKRVIECMMIPMTISEV